MKYRALIVSVCFAFLAIDASATTAYAEVNMCARLKEISSLDPKKSILWGHEEPDAVCRSLYWSEFRPLPLPSILSGENLANYRRAASHNECSAAATVLSNGFADAHPNAPSILTNEDNYKAWKSRTVGGHFPLLALCFGLERVRKAQAEIDRLGIRAEPYAGFKKSIKSHASNELPTPVRQRHHAIFAIHLSLASTKSPAIALALLKLSVEGKALKYHEKNELYLAFRLRMKGVREPVIDHVISREVDVRWKLDIEQKAKFGNFKSIPQYPE